MFFLVPITMCDKKHKQQFNATFLVKLKKKNLIECYKLLKGPNGENSLSHVYVFKLYKRFSEGKRVQNMTNVQVDLSLFQLHKW